MAATFDPGRKFGGVVALGQIRGPASQPLLRNLVADPDPMTRAVAAISL